MTVAALSLRQAVVELQNSELWPEAEIEQLQSSLLATLIAHHHRHTPAFAARLRRARLNPGDVNAVGTLSRLPVLTRRDIQSLGTNFYCKKIPADHQPVGSTMTSGSTGEPVTISKSSVCRTYWGANTAREHRWNGRDVTGRLLSIRPTIEARTALKDWGYPMAALGRTGAALGLPTSMNIEEHLQCIDDFQPDTLLVFPNLLMALIGEWERRGKSPASIRHFKTVGESVRDDLRERAQRVCGLRIEDSYSSQECGIIAIQCPQGLYHVMSESLVIEVLDAEGNPCRPGDVGRLVATDLRNLASPLIRYEIGDLAERAGACRCGLKLPTLGRIMGRDRNLLVTPDGNRRYPIIGFHLFHEVADVLQFRFIQHTVEKIELIVHTRTPLTAEQAQGLAKIVQNALGYPFDVQVNYSATPMPRSAGGKFEDFISKVAS